jgi:hypothetical protein
MAISVTPTVHNAPYGLDQTAVRSILHGSLVWAAGTYATGGITPPTPPWQDASGQNVLLATQNVQPDELYAYSVAGSGFVYQYNKSTGKWQIFVTGTAAGDPLEELAAAALPDGVTSDTIEFFASWVRA